MKKFSIPKGAGAFHAYQGLFAGRCAEHAAAWGIPQQVISQLSGYQNQWEPAYAVTANRSTSSPSDTAARQAVFTPYKKAIAATIKKYLLDNEAVPAAELAALGITDSVASRSALVAPASHPILQIDLGEITAHRLILYDSDNPGHRGKPARVGFCELWYQVGGTAPLLPDKATMEQLNVSRSGSTFRFSSADRGKMVYYFARWVSILGAAGSWSPVVSAPVP